MRLHRDQSSPQAPLASMCEAYGATVPSSEHTVLVPFHVHVLVLHPHTQSPIDLSPPEIVLDNCYLLVEVNGHNNITAIPLQL